MRKETSPFPCSVSYYGFHTSPSLSKASGGRVGEELFGYLPWNLQSEVLTLGTFPFRHKYTSGHGTIFPINDEHACAIFSI